MPICERDPWRLQYFAQVPCPDSVLIPTDDADAWTWYAAHRWIYDKLRVAASQGLACGPHGVTPERFPVFSKPMMNMKGMGIGSRAMVGAAELDRHYQPGHMWMELLEGRHVSTDCAVLDGIVVWSRHATGVPGEAGTFRHWTIHAAPDRVLDAYLGSWVVEHMAGYSGMMNFETINGRIIEAHLRFADQWVDLYGGGWVEALVGLYARNRWKFADTDRRDGYSVPLFATHGAQFRHPSMQEQAAIRAMPGVSSLQITFFETKNPSEHPMPPGGFRLGIVNGFDLERAKAARRALAASFPAEFVKIEE